MNIKTRLFLCMAFLFPLTLLAQSAEAAEGGGFLFSLLHNPFVALFAIVGLGLQLGNFRVAGLSLGSSGVLFVALVFGHFQFQIPSGLGTLGLILFIFCVGLGAGPGFIRVFRSEGKQLALVSIVVVLTAGGCSYGFARLFDLPTDLVVGLFAGAMTSTPALAAAMDALHGSGQLVSVGYGIAYPFGVIGVVLFVQLLPRLLKKDLDVLANELDAKSPGRPGIVSVLVEVSNEALQGKEIESYTEKFTHGVRFSRLLRGDRLVPLPYGTCFEKGQVLRMVGDEEHVNIVIDLVGVRVSPEHVKGTNEKDLMDVVVTNREFFGRTLKELSFFQKYGVVITRVIRNELMFVPGRDTRLEPLDQIRVVGDPNDIDRFQKKCGHKPKSLQETDLLSLALGLLAGVVLGLTPFSFAGMPEVTIGLSGGLLLVSIALGHFGRIGWVSGRIPAAARNLMMELGLVFFLANAGVKAGGSFLAVLKEQGIVLFLVGAGVTIVPMLTGFLFANQFLKVDLLRCLGGICGSMTSTPALGAIRGKTDSDIPVISYAAAYPVALILMLTVAQVLVFMLLKTV